MRPLRKVCGKKEYIRPELDECCYVPPFPTRTKSIQDPCAEMKNSTSMTIPKAKKGSIDCEQRSTMCQKTTHAPPHRKNQQAQASNTTESTFRMPKKKFLCSFVRRQNTCRTLLTTDDGKKTKERAFMCVAIPCKKAMIDQAHTFDCCVSTTCSPIWTISTMGNSDLKQ